ncbi:MAG: polysaccharide deacetylase family protein [Gammaproteobacteria bacterium]|nr:polysaccharide deacetylase family protein [Gammaproteobacteria bacterium]
MLVFKRFCAGLVFMFTALLACVTWAEQTINIPILCYHNLNPTVPGSMNLSPQKFESQIKWLKDNGYTVVPLKEVVDYLQGARQTLPPKSVVVTADDGWQSVYTYMWPIIRKYNIPVTLFIYPQTISQGKNAMTWEELKELQRTGLFDIQSHTYWHPNFKKEKKKRSGSAYEQFVSDQLQTSKKILEDKLGIKVTLLAWPFGIYDHYLEQASSKAGYVMAFSIDARTANRSFRPMAQPRFMIVDGLSMKTFTTIIRGASS